MNQTANYGLNLWEKTDRIQMEDFNADNAKIDAALAAQAEALAPITEQIGKLGNCQIYTADYVGDGNINTIPSHTFPAKPMVVMISSESSGYVLLFWRGCHEAPLLNDSSYVHTITWSGNTASWYYASTVHGSLNIKGVTYHIVALLDVSAE